MEKNEILTLLDRYGEELFFELSELEDAYDLTTEIMEGITKYPSDKELLDKLIQCLLNKPDEVKITFIDVGLYHYFEISSKEFCLPYLINLIESQNYDKAYAGLTLAESHICLEIAPAVASFLTRDYTDESGIEYALGILEDIDNKFHSNFHELSQSNLTLDQLSMMENLKSRDEQFALMNFMSIADEAYNSRNFEKCAQILEPLLDKLPSKYLVKYKISVKRAKTS